MLRRYANFEVTAARLARTASSGFLRSTTAHRTDFSHVEVKPGYSVEVRVCAVEGCDRTIVARGWCRRHYLQWYKGQTPHLHVPAKYQVCIVQGCTDTQVSQGCCGFHYRRKVAGLPSEGPRRYAKSECSFPGCVRPHSAHGLCDGHNIQRRKGKELTPLRRREAGRRCEIPECANPHLSRGMCMQHYNRWHWDSTVGKATRKTALMRRRARLLDADVRHVTVKDLRKILAKPCTLCGAQSTQVDHIIPLSKGGRHSVGNLQGLCASCNSKKRARLMVVAKRVVGSAA
jgi:5-methylcytosine-specific restriction endonuclease McrA